MKLLIIGLTVYFSYTAIQKRQLYFKYLFNPYRIQHHNEWYRWISAQFIHADYNHLLYNMLTAYFFMPTVEKMFESKSAGFLFPLFYVLAGAEASVPDFIKHRNNPSYNAVGASGAVSAVLFYFIYNQAFSTILVFFIPMPAVLYAVLFIGYSVVMEKKNTDNIGHIAHLTGAAFGLLVALCMDKLF